MQSTLFVVKSPTDTASCHRDWTTVSAAVPLADPSFPLEIGPCFDGTHARGLSIRVVIVATGDRVIPALFDSEGWRSSTFQRQFARGREGAARHWGPAPVRNFAR